MLREEITFLEKKHLSTNLQSLLDECLFSQTMADCSSIISAVLIEVWYEIKMYLLTGVLVLHHSAVWGILWALFCAHNDDGGGHWGGMEGRMDGWMNLCSKQRRAAERGVSVSPVLYISHRRICHILKVPSEWGEPGPHTLHAHCHSAVVRCMVSSGSLNFMLCSSGWVSVLNTWSRYPQNKSSDCWYITSA